MPFFRWPQIAILILVATSAGAADPAPGSTALAAPNAPSAPAAPNDWVAAKLKAAVLEAEPRITEGKPMEAWQRRLFEDEAAPQYKRFVRDYRASLKHSGSAANSVVADLDLESLKNYIRFYAPAAPMAVLLRPAVDCEKCADADVAIRKLVKMRLERRGFALTYLTVADLGAEGGALSGTALEAKLAEVAVARNLSSQFLLEWAPVPTDDIDAAHADDKRYFARAVVMAKGFTRTEHRLEVGEVDPLEVAVGKALADTFTTLGTQVAAKSKAAAQPVAATNGADAPELELEIRGINSYAQHAAVRAAVLAKLASSGLSGAEERKISRGKLVIGLPGKRGPASISADEVKGQVSGLPVESGRLNFVSVGGTPEDPLLVMEISP